MIDFSDKTMAKILAAQLQRVPDSIDKREGSMIYTALAPEAWSLEGLYILMNQIQQNAWIESAVSIYLDYKVAERGLIRNAATPAEREGIFNVMIPEGFRCSTINGDASLNFVALDDCALDTTDNYYHVTLVCETAGVAGNDYAGAVLPITYIAALDYAQIGTILVAGTDEESDDALRARYELSLQEQPFGGNIASYRKEILDIDNVGAVQVYPVWDGGGTIKCSILDANYDKATTNLIATVQTIICPPESGQDTPSEKGYGLAPVGAIVTIATGTDFEIDLETSVTIQAGYTFSAIKAEIEEVFEDYLLELRTHWGNPVSGTLANYVIYCYISKINSEILNIEGVLNVTGTELNGQAVDVLMIETGEEQQIPVKGTVTVNESS